MCRRSHKHVLDWTSREEFPSKLLIPVSPCPVEMGTDARWMPKGSKAWDEARLERCGLHWLPGHPAWSCLRDRWSRSRRWGELWGVPDLADSVTVELGRRFRSSLGLCRPAAGRPVRNWRCVECLRAGLSGELVITRMAEGTGGRGRGQQREG